MKKLILIPIIAVLSVSAVVMANQEPIEEEIVKTEQTEEKATEQKPKEEKQEEKPKQQVIDTGTPVAITPEETQKQKTERYENKVDTSLKEGEITAVKISPLTYPDDDNNMINGFVCEYTINTVTRYKIARIQVPKKTDCKKVGDLYF